VEEQVPAAAAPPEADRVVLSQEQIASAGVVAELARSESVSAIFEVPAMLASPDTASATIGSVVEGRVASIAVLPGDAVSEGQELMRVHSHELTDAVRDLRATEARLIYASAAAQRSEALLAAGAVSREEVERRTSDRAALEADLTRGLEWVEHLSPSEDGLVVVRAPRSGSVFSVLVTTGQAVLPGEPLVAIGRTDVLWATGWVPETQSVRLAAGDPIQLTIPALPGLRIPARVVQVGAAVDPDRRAVEVRAELSGVPDGVRPGSFATMLLPSGPGSRQVVLPSSAVQRTAGGEVVFVEERPGVYRAVSVSAVPLDESRVGVTGVPDGARVVVSGAYALRSVLDGNAAQEGAS
jgi:RND family efflux transporter MFP subunit